MCNFFLPSTHKSLLLLSDYSSTAVQWNCSLGITTLDVHENWSVEQNPKLYHVVVVLAVNTWSQYYARWAKYVFCWFGVFCCNRSPTGWTTVVTEELGRSDIEGTNDLLNCDCFSDLLSGLHNYDHWKIVASEWPVSPVMFDLHWTIASLKHNPLMSTEQQTIIRQYGDWYTGHWWVSCCIWYSKEGPRRNYAKKIGQGFTDYASLKIVTDLEVWWVLWACLPLCLACPVAMLLHACRQCLWSCDYTTLKKSDYYYSFTIGRYIPDGF